MIDKEATTKDQEAKANHCEATPIEPEAMIKDKEALI